MLGETSNRTKERQGYAAVMNLLPFTMVKSKTSCQNLGRNPELWTKSRKLARKEGTAVFWLNPSQIKRKSSFPYGDHVHSDTRKEGSAQPSASEDLYLQFSSLARGYRFYQFKIRSLYVTLEIVCGNGLTYPSMPKR